MLTKSELNKKIKLLIRKRISSKMKLSVKLAIVKDLYEKEGVYAWCENLDMFMRNPRNFKISLDESFLKPENEHNLLELYITIAHELIHVEQYAHNRLFDKLGVQVWEGVPIHRDTPYEELPWEKEAYEKEEEWAQDLIG
ncbi:hypothetical protein [Synechococcus phage BUCT-ZZ01]|nr:hypothetical protein [Synechococcus phage BUCT-ZZ01]